MKTDVFDPKAGSLEIEFSDGTSYSLSLTKNYHREQAFYVDLLWEEDEGGISLSLALHPKAQDLILSSCKLQWPLPSGFPSEVLLQGFTEPLDTDWTSLLLSVKPVSFWQKRALKKMNTYDPLPHPAASKASYQSISLRQNKQQVTIRSTDESAALTVFSLSKNAQFLYAENQSVGYKLRHSFPTFELRFTSSNTHKKQQAGGTSQTFSVAVSAAWIEQSSLAELTNSTLFEEGNFLSIVLKDHENPCPGRTGFDESLFSAFAKTCHETGLQAGISLSPFVATAEANTHSLTLVQDATYKRWSPSLKQWVYPLSLSDEDTLRACEQHVMRYYQLGFRLFELNDIALSLHDGAGNNTTGQQLNQRLDLIRRILPEVTVILGDLCASELLKGFQGFKSESPPRTQLPLIARLAGLGTEQKHGKLAPFRLACTAFSSPVGLAPKSKHYFLKLSEKPLELSTWIALESTLESKR